MIHVVAVITAKPGQRETILEAFRANVPAVHAAQGCIEYGPVIDAPAMEAKIGDDTCMVLEKSERAEALAAHAKAPHMATYAAKVKDLIATRAVHILPAA